MAGNNLITTSIGSDGDGVYFRLSDLASLSSGTYAFYIELKGEDDENYPDNEVKYITFSREQGNLVLKNVFEADSSGLKPKGITPEEDQLHIHNVTLNDIKVESLKPSSKPYVYLDQNDILHFGIPQGQDGLSLYDLAIKNGFQGSLDAFLKTLVGPAGPQGVTGRSTWSMMIPVKPYATKLLWNTLNGASQSLPPKVNDTVIMSNGKIALITKVTPDDRVGGYFDIGNYIGDLSNSSGGSTNNGIYYSAKELTNNQSGVSLTVLKPSVGINAVISPGSLVLTPAGNLFMITSITKQTFTVGLVLTNLHGSNGDPGVVGPTGATGPQGIRGYSFWSMKMAVGGNVSGRYITDLYNASKTNMPMVGDMVLQPGGSVYQVTGVSNTDDGSNGGGTFNLGSALFSINDQTEYQALNDKLNNMQIGGRNLVLNTDQDIVVNDTANTGTSGFCYGTIKLTQQLKVGDQVTISAEGTLTGKGDLNTYEAYLYDSAATNSRSLVASLVPGKRSSATLTVTNLGGNGDTVLFIYAGRFSDNEGKKLVLHHLKVELGNVATDWTPAPEDAMTSIQNNASDIATLNSSAMQNRGTVDLPDFNLLTQAGFYTITNPGGGKNYPTGSWGTLEVNGEVTDGNGRIEQKYVGDLDGTTFTRLYNNGNKTWTAWVKVANQHDIDTLSEEINSLQQKVSSISEDDILAKTKQYVDDDILNGKW